jgi:hypothetical protein
MASSQVALSYAGHPRCADSSGPHPPPQAPQPPPPIPPAGWTLHPWHLLAAGTAILYWWPESGWLLGRVTRPATRPPFSHVLRYRRPVATFNVTSNVDTLLDTASYGKRWVALGPALSCVATRSVLP